MPFRLLKYAQQELSGRAMFRAPEKLKSTYDAVIIGGGHGLAAAYYLARDHGRLMLPYWNKLSGQRGDGA
jgi:sarcosine oxidase subunit beta